MSAPLTSKLDERWAESLERLEPLSGPEWLNDLRGRAARSFRSAGLPHRKIEAWKYTPMRVLEDLAPDLSQPVPAATQAAFPEPLTGTAPRIDVFGGVPGELPSGLPEGLSVLSLKDGIERFGSRIEPIVSATDIEGPSRAMSALNTALLSQGLVIHAAADSKAGSLLLRSAFAETDVPMMGQFRVIVLLDEGAELDLIEQFETAGRAAGALNLVLQADLGPRSSLGHVRVQAESDAAVLFTSASVRQAGQSRYRYRGFDLGGRLVRHEWDVRLSGEDASADLSGAFMLDGRQHVDNHVSVSHESANCSSEQFFRGVLGGRSRGVFNGRALICPGADGSSVRQSNANLLLSPLAEMDTKPELEIYADEVEASHGATVGQIDESAVFYLRTRGLSDGEARRMLTTAFCHAVTDRLSDRELAERVAALMDEAMPDPEAPDEGNE
jgi:Fe-S cluster assembly protein SufD